VPHAFECDSARSSATPRVSDRLDSLAGQHPLISEALLTISGSVRNTATLLEMLVATKIAPVSGLDPPARA
jgi:hypothetical protein